MRRVLFTLMLTLFCLSYMSVAQSPSVVPYDLKGDRLGSTLDAFKTKYHHSLKGDPRFGPFCKESANGLSECEVYFPFEKRFGSATETVANAPADLRFEFVDGRLWAISAVFKQTDFEMVKQAFIDKVGSRPSCDSQVYQNAYGAKFPGESCQWKNGISTIALLERASNLETSTLRMEHLELAPIANSRKPKPKPDL